MKIVAAVLAAAWIGAGSARGGLDWVALHNEARSKTWSDMTEAERSTNQPADRIYVGALRLLAAHRNDEAARHFQAVADKEPAEAGGEWGLAEALRRRHESKESRIGLAKIVQQRPEFSPAIVSLAYVDFLERRFQDAVDTAGKVIARGEAASDAATFAMALVLVARSKSMMAHEGGAVAKVRYGPSVQSGLKRALRLWPEGPEVMLDLGGFYIFAPRLAGGDLDQGIAMLERAIAADPLMPEAYVRLAQAFRMKGDEERYRTLLKQAQSLDPRNELVEDVVSGRCLFICVEAKK